MNTKQNIAKAVGAAAMLACGAASAYPVLPNGTIRFNFTGWDEGTVNYPSNPAAPHAVCGTVQATGGGNAAACDAVAGILPAQKAYVVNPAGSGGPALEDTWGAVRIDSLQSGTGPGVTTFWSNPAGNAAGTPHLSAYYYGLTDGIITNDGTATGTYSYGGTLDVYYNEGTDPSSGTNNVNLRDTTRAISQAWTPIIDAPGSTLMLRLSFAPGGNANVQDATLQGSFLNATAFGGSGSLMNVDVTGGVWAYRFDTDSILGSDGVFHDFQLQVGFQCTSSVCDPSNSTPLPTVELNGSFRGFAVPEPASALLMVPGLLYLSRRKARA